MPEPRIVTLSILGRPPLVNAERSSHWTKQSTTTKALRMESCLRLSKEGRKGMMARVKVDVRSLYTDYRLPDTAACMPAAKAIIDGAVDAGLLAHDGPQIVKYVAFWAPVCDPEVPNQIVVTFEELEEDSPWAM